MKLRSYQQESVDNVIAYWQSGGGHPLVVLPTGTGKSLVAAAMMTQLRRDYGARVLLATHVSELVSQNYRALSKYWPEAPRGIYHAGLGKRDGSAPICIAGIHSIFKTPEVVGERDVLLIDECFVSGTMIETPRGQVQIQDIKRGDIVLNAFGIGTVEAVSIKKSFKLCKVKLSNGKTIRCTPNHPFFTERGWISASGLVEGDAAFCKEDVRNLREGLCAIESRGKAALRSKEELLEILLREVDSRPEEREANYRVQGVFDSVRSGEKKHQMLLKVLREQNERTARLCEKELVEVEKESVHGVRLNIVSYARRSATILGSKTILLNQVLKDGISKLYEVGSHKRKSVEKAKKNGACASIWRRKWQWVDGATSAIDGLARSLLARVGARNCYVYATALGWGSESIQGRHSYTKRDDLHRDRWPVSSVAKTTRAGCKEGSSPDRVRVVSVSLEERGRNENVYNLQVSGHPSYFADGVLVHNCHMLSHKNDGMYRKLIAHFERANPGFRVCGLTATPYRMSTGMLTEDYGDHAALFDDIVYEMPILKAINQGWLVPILPYVSPERFDVSKVKTSAGDYNKKQLQDAVDKDEISARIAAEVAAVMQNKQRSTGLTFASGIQHAQHLCEHYNRLGITAETITEKTKEREKADILERARKGQLQMVVGVGTITTGIDIPNVDILVCARPTRSKGLWTQILGRGSRLSPETGKTDCLLLDFTDNSILIGPLDTLDGHKEKGEQGAPPQRACPDCQHVHHISLRNCPMCNHEYPAHELKVSAMSRAGPVFSTQEEPVWLDVDSIRVKKHVKANKAPSLRIEYLCGFRSVYHWVPLEHETAHGFAKQWWRRNSINDGDPPETVDEALQRIGELRVPGRIQVTKDGSFEKVTSHDYSIPPGRWTPPIEKPMSIEDAYRRER